MRVLSRARALWGHGPQPSRPRLSGSGALAPAARTHGPVNATGLFAQRRCNSDFTARQPPLPGSGARPTQGHLGPPLLASTEDRAAPRSPEAHTPCEGGAPRSAGLGCRQRPSRASGCAGGLGPPRVRSEPPSGCSSCWVPLPRPSPSPEQESRATSLPGTPHPSPAPLHSCPWAHAAESRPLTVGAWRSPRSAWGWGAGCSEEGDQAPPRIEPRGCRAAWHSPGPRGSPPSPPPPPLSEQLCAQRAHATL